MIKGNIITLFLIFLVSNLLFFSITLSIPVGDETKEVKCYDRFSNEIQGLTCESKVYGYDSYLQRNLILIIGVSIINIMNFILNKDLLYL